MAGFINDSLGREIVFCNNVDFTGNVVPAATMIADGDLLIGSSVQPNIRVATLTAGTGVTVTNGHGSITIAASAIMATTFTTDNATTATPAANNLNLFGTTAQGLTSSATGSTVTFTIADWTTSQKGVGVLATNAQAIAGIVSTAAITPTSLAAKLGAQTAHGLPIGEGTTSAITWTAAPVAGQLLIGTSGTTDPVLNTLTAGTGITITNGSGTITIAAAGGAVEVETLTGNSGGAISPTAGNINTLGAGSITIAGSGSTLTTQLTGLTNHAVLVGAGTSTITNVGPTAVVGQVLQSAGSSADPAFSTATYPLTTTINQILFSSAANAVTGLATANSATLVTTSAGVPVFTGTMTNGQIIVGSTGATPTAATLTAGTGVSIVNAAGAITINATGAGLTWQEISTATNAVANNGYIATAALTLTLPSAPAMGTTVGTMVLTTGALTIKAQNTDTIRMGAQVSAAAGTAVSQVNAAITGASVQLIYDATSGVWFQYAGATGTWNVT